MRKPVTSNQINHTNRTPKKMGRPLKRSEDKRQEILSVNLTTAEKKQLLIKARKEKLLLSSYVRNLLFP